MYEITIQVNNNVKNCIISISNSRISNNNNFRMLEEEWMTLKYYEWKKTFRKRLESIRRLQIKAEFIIGGLAANSNANASNKGGMVAMGGSRNNQGQGPNKRQR